ncbi:MAG: protein kinase [Gemmatimonadota bacterium]
MAESATRLAQALAGRYRIERELGQGGMATVYLAQDLRHDRKVAVKVLRPELAAVIGAERFLAEIKTTANLQHPHILALFDSGTVDGTVYYVMPFVEGESLRDRLTREKQLPVDDALRIAREAADALEYAHQHGVIHRDIKPENILLHGGHALVADFGIALAASKTGGSRMTETGMSLGTPHYMSPEQAMGERDLDARTDIYALGCVTYEMLTGDPPFTASTAQGIVAKVMTEKPASIVGRRDRVPAHVEDAVLTALEKLPADRFGTAAEFAAALQGDGGDRRTATRATVVGSRSRAVRLAFLITLAAAAVATAFVLGRRSGAAGGETTVWRGELLGGPQVALAPRLSPDGQLIAFAAMVDGQTQLAVLKPQSGDWKVLTSDRTMGLTGEFSWSADNSRIYYARFFEAPRGVYSISPLGTGERLVLADAGSPEALPDGSLLVSRLNVAGTPEMCRYWPDSGRLDTLPALGTLETGNSTFFRAFPDGQEAAFYGTVTGRRDSVAHLYVIDLTSREVRRLAPGRDILPVGSVGSIQLAVTPDGRSVVVGVPTGNSAQLTAVPRDGSNRVRVLATLAVGQGGFDFGPDGSIYFDEALRLTELRRYDPASRRVASWPLPGADGTFASLLALPDGRVLYSAAAAGGSRIMAFAPGEEPQPFMTADQESHGPMALLGPGRIALMLGADSNAVLAIASTATGQVESRLPGVRPTQLAGSPDGKTLYYVQASGVWAMPSGGGTPRRIHNGESVAVDPQGRYLVISFVADNTVKLARVPLLDRGAEEEIAVRGDLRLSPGAMLASNAIGPDGRIVLTVISPASWFWPAAILDPRTGKLEVLPPVVGYDMYGGWDPSGRVVYYAQGLESRLWRYRPVSTNGPQP